MDSQPCLRKCRSFRTRRLATVHTHDRGSRRRGGRRERGPVAAREALEGVVHCDDALA
ncbi:MAG: hypothetical protein GY873_33950 [Bosea sp.]|jgi:hypothetical protein|uniref:hypothetical protein n=1 Tax=Bosea sp. (in: a-proteobacteria) TaxID=1871050 RepID=UPI0023A18538|nr:hypothetical protein [Bosea sp. (in: a-proteobacteria)]MDG2027355.1 hypothetical protein [Acidimicrobiales bacterium]